MAIYSGFARFYDRIMGDRTPEIDRILGYVRRYQPGAQSLLELGCGTGALLAGLAGAGLTVTGIDQSPQMLEVAARAVPAARLLRGDMTQFRLGARFDVVICMFDTLNHVQSFAGWRALFDCVHAHLADGGLFVFDVNTAGRLARLHGAPPYLDEFDGNVVIMTVRPGPDGLTRWDTRIFEPQRDDLYRLYHEQIYELGAPLAQIRGALAAEFELLEESSLDGNTVTDDSSRVFFAYRRRTPLPAR